MPPLNISQESIAFQNGAFFKELTLSFAEIQKVRAQEELEGHEEIVTLSATIKHRSGLNVTISIDEYEPCVEIPMINKNNILINNFIRDWLSSADGLKMIADADGAVRGSVNLKTGIVTGVFSEVPSIIHLPYHMFLTSKYTPEEIAAITLHEVGHLFTYYEFMSRVVTTNQVLAGMSKALDGSADVTERESVLINTRQALKLKDLDVQELAKSTNSKIVEIVVITNVAKEAESELGHNIYDFSTWEMLADQFAARQGAGRYVVTALDKLYRGYWNISFRSLPAYLAFEALKFVLTLLPWTTMLGLVLVAGDGAGDGTYDTPGARFKRVRNQIIENLKDKKLSKDDQERLAADLLVIDDILRKVNDRRQFFGVIFDALLPSLRRARKEELLQKDLEAIANNDLFAKAAELKNVSL